MEENSIKEDINYLDNMVKEYKQFGNLYNEEYEDEDRIYQALEHILSDYKRVLKENEEYYKQLDLDYVENNFISKQKVKDKIGQYKKMLFSCNKFSDVDRIKAINERILMLEDLLESEE